MNMNTIFTSLFRYIVSLIRSLFDCISSLVISIKSKFTNTNSSNTINNNNCSNTNTNTINNNNNNNDVDSNVLNNTKKQVSRGPGRPPLTVEVYDRYTESHLATFYSVVIAESMLHIRHNSIKRAIEANRPYKNYIFKYRK